MNQRLIDIEDVRNVFKKVGFEPEERVQCANWTSTELDQPITSEDRILAELTPEEEGFLRCMGYAHEEKRVDRLYMRALYETFWKTVRDLHALPLEDIAVKEGKYLVSM